MEVLDGAAIDWLMAGDAAMEYQTRRDLLGQADPALEARIAADGDVAAILAARGETGHWGRGFYQPKWTSTHYTLLELANLGLPATHPAARDSVAMVLREEKGPDGGLNPSRTLGRSDVCINGMALNYCSHFAAPTDAVASLVDFVLGQRLADGGFNCRSNRSGATHSSVHTSLSVIEGCTAYLAAGHDHRADEVRQARGTAIEFLLRHRLFRSHRTGEPIHADMTRLHHPTRWHFDILRCLDALAAAGVERDARMDDGLDLLRERRRPDGRWAADSGHPGQTHITYPRAGAPNRWVTLAALRVLLAYGQAGRLPGSSRHPARV